MAITVKVLDMAWNLEAEFEGEKNVIFSDSALKYGSDIPVSCGSGACGLCKCKIIEWLDLINPEMLSPSLMEMDEGFILACIAGIKDDVEEWTIIMQRML